MGTKSKSVYSSHTGWAGVQVPVHIPCNSFEATTWRTRVTVVVNISWWFDKRATHENEKDINCRV